MIEVSIDMLPMGDESQRHTLRTIKIINLGDHPERPAYGNYKVIWDIDGATHEQFIHSHIRWHGLEVLLARIFKEVGQDIQAIEVLDKADKFIKRMEKRDERHPRRVSQKRSDGKNANSET